jgi:hypothetical protein
MAIFSDGELNPGSVGKEARLYPLECDV